MKMIHGVNEKHNCPWHKAPADWPWAGDFLRSRYGTFGNLWILFLKARCDVFISRPPYWETSFKTFFFFLNTRYNLQLFLGLESCSFLICLSIGKKSGKLKPCLCGQSLSRDGGWKTRYVLVIPPPYRYSKIRLSQPWTSNKSLSLEEMVQGADFPALLCMATFFFVASSFRRTDRFSVKTSNKPK